MEEAPKTSIAQRFPRARRGRRAGEHPAPGKLLTEVVMLQLGKLEPGVAAGKMMLSMLAVVAQMERDLLVERTQAGLQRARAEGRMLGRLPPAGYRGVLMAFPQRHARFHVVQRGVSSVDIKVP